MIYEIIQILIICIMNYWDRERRKRKMMKIISYEFQIRDKAKEILLTRIIKREVHQKID